MTQLLPAKSLKEWRAMEMMNPCYRCGSPVREEQAHKYAA